MTTPVPRVDLRLDHWAIVRSALRRHVPDREVLAFGSRATWTAKEYSDLDLAVMGEEPLSLRTASALDEALGDSDLPFKVDVVDWARIDEGFRRIVRRHAVVVQAPAGTADAIGPERRPPTSSCSNDGNEWPRLSLRAAGVSLFDCEHRTPPAQEFGFPYVGIPQIRDGRINVTGARRITRGHFDEWTRRSKPESFDVVLSRRCNPGETGFVPPGLEFALGQNLVLLRSNGQRVFKPFLRWICRGPQWWEQVAKYINVGAVFDSLKCADIPEFELPIPPIPEQRAIAHILGTLDDKIELNRRMNETLEAMARALYKSWFVDFDPVRAKMEGRDTGLPRDIADLFPSRLVDSEIGEIPEGWKVATLAERIEVNPRRPLRKGQVAPYLPMAKMPTRGHMPDSVAVRPFGSGMRFANGDTLVARITPCLENGKTAYVDFLADGEIGWGSTEYIVLRPQPPLPKPFAYCLARSSSFRMFAVQNMSGTSGRQRVSPAALRGFLLVEPPGQLAGRFGEVAGPLFERARNRGHESRILAALRDALLPKLISGSIRVGRSATKKEGHLG